MNQQDPIGTSLIILGLFIVIVAVIAWAVM